MKRVSSGFSLIEAIIAVSLLGIALAAIVPSFVSYAGVNRDSEIKTQALAVAQEVFDELRWTGTFSNWPASGTLRQISREGRTFDAVITWCTSELELCDTNIRHVQVEVRFNDRTYFTAQTAYTQFERN